MLIESSKRKLEKKTVMSILLLIFKTVIDLAITLSLSGKEPPSGNKNSFCDLPKTVALLVVFPDICIVKIPARKGGTLFEVNSNNFIISVKCPLML